MRLNISRISEELPVYVDTCNCKLKWYSESTGHTLTYTENSKISIGINGKTNPYIDLERDFCNMSSITFYIDDEIVTITIGKETNLVMLRRQLLKLINFARDSKTLKQVVYNPDEFKIVEDWCRLNSVESKETYKVCEGYIIVTTEKFILLNTAILEVSVYNFDELVSLNIYSDTDLLYRDTLAGIVKRESSKNLILYIDITTKDGKHIHINGFVNNIRLLINLLLMVIQNWNIDKYTNYTSILLKDKWEITKDSILRLKRVVKSTIPVSDNDVYDYELNTSVAVDWKCSMNNSEITDSRVSRIIQNADYGECLCVTSNELHVNIILHLIDEDAKSYAVSVLSHLGITTKTTDTLLESLLNTVRIESNSEKYKNMSLKSILSNTSDTKFKCVLSYGLLNTYGLYTYNGIYYYDDDFRSTYCNMVKHDTLKYAINANYKSYKYHCNPNNLLLTLLVDILTSKFQVHLKKFLSKSVINLYSYCSTVDYCTTDFSDLIEQTYDNEVKLDNIYTNYTNMLFTILDASFVSNSDKFIHKLISDSASDITSEYYKLEWIEIDRINELDSYLDSVLPILQELKCSIDEKDKLIDALNTVVKFILIRVTTAPLVKLDIKYVNILVNISELYINISHNEDSNVKIETLNNLKSEIVELLGGDYVG